MLVIFGALYMFGLHTEVIGQVQRLLLATGIKKAEMPEPVAASNTVSLSNEPTSEASGMVGTGFQMIGLDGKPMAFESLKGKVIFLNIWATWCPPCIAEMPNIQSLYEKVGSDKVAFVMLSVDESGMDKVKKYTNKKGYTFPVYMPASQVPQEFHSNSIPTTFIISPEGKIVARQEGMAEYDTPEVQEFLQSMLK